MLKVIGIIMLFIVVIYQITKYFTKENTTIQEDVPTFTQDELDNIKLVEELYNKDLRSQAAKAAENIEVVDAQLVKSKQIKPEFPIDKPKKRRPANKKKKA